MDLRAAATASRSHTSDQTAKRSAIRPLIGRIRSLAIPPAWKDVWICPAANGHMQATGRDARGRKQYRYHPRWREAQDETQVRAHDRVRASAAQDSSRRRPPSAQARACRARRCSRPRCKLLETTLIRVGNEEYARDNHSFGLTTMHDEHVKIRGATIRFDFRGKRGIEHEIDLKDRRLAAIVHACHDLPGQELFQYLDDAGEVRDVGSADVNDYLREISGEDFTAKDFRTWAGTVLAAQALQEFQEFDSTAAPSGTSSRRSSGWPSGSATRKPSAARCYVHPAIIEAYMDRSLVKTLKRRTEKELRGTLRRLSGEEAAVLALLQQRMEQELTGQKKSRRKNGSPSKQRWIEQTPKRSRARCRRGSTGCRGRVGIGASLRRSASRGCSTGSR